MILSQRPNRTDGNYSRSERSIMYTFVKSLSRTLETNVILCVNHSQKKKKKLTIIRQIHTTKGSPQIHASLPLDSRFLRAPCLRLFVITKCRRQGGVPKQRFISPGSGAWKSEIRIPAWLAGTLFWVAGFLSYTHMVKEIILKLLKIHHPEVITISALV